MAQGENLTCVAAIGSITPSLKAARILKNEGFHAEVVALSASETKRGCAYGVTFACEEAARVRRALLLGGISVSQYLQRGESP